MIDVSAFQSVPRKHHGDFSIRRQSLEYRSNARIDHAYPIGVQPYVTKQILPRRIRDGDDRIREPDTALYHPPMKSLGILGQIRRKKPRDDIVNDHHVSYGRRPIEDRRCLEEVQEYVAAVPLRLVRDLFFPQPFPENIVPAPPMRQKDSCPEIRIEDSFAWLLQIQDDFGTLIIRICGKHDRKLLQKMQSHLADTCGRFPQE